MKNELKENNKTYLYENVIEYINNIIESDNLEPGDVLPTESDLERILNVSRTTIRAAISELQSSGIVNKIQGSGTFVADQSYERQLPQLKSFTEDAAARGCTVSSIVLSKDLIIADEEIIRKLNISKSDQVLKLSRVRCINNQPIQLTSSFMPLKRIRNLSWKEIDFTKESLYGSLEKVGIMLAYGEERTEVAIADALEAMLLNVPEGLPLFITKRIVVDKKDNIIEYSESKTRGDRHKGVIKLKR